MITNDNQGLTKTSLSNAGWEIIGDIKNPKEVINKLVNKIRNISDPHEALQKIVEEPAKSAPLQTKTNLDPSTSYLQVKI
jgi:hypothetical protein